jgi:hypothetical protein
MLKFKILTVEKQYPTAACCLITDFNIINFLNAFKAYERNVHI